MKSFPIILRKKVTDCFDRITELYNQDSVKLLDAAEVVFASEKTPFTKNGLDVPPQLVALRKRFERTGDNYGRNALIKWIEELQSDLDTNGAIGINNSGFAKACAIEVDDGVQLKFTSDRGWVKEWCVLSQEENVEIRLHIHNRHISTDNIVPDYIIQYVEQSIMAYKKKNYLVALAMISISLEGTLRDALDFKGYTYRQGAPAVDIYDYVEIGIQPDPRGFLVTVPSTMPVPHTNFLNTPSSDSQIRVRIKRGERRGNLYLEMRDVDSLKDFWSSDTIVQEGQKSIGGLGTALDIARNDAAILDDIILPSDTDEVIKKVRNNLIHLSGLSLTTPIPNTDMTLGDFLSEESRIFDTIWSITGAIDALYIKRADGTL